MKRISMVALLALTVTAFMSCDLFTTDTTGTEDTMNTTDSVEVNDVLLDATAGQDSLLLTDDVEIITHD